MSPTICGSFTDTCVALRKGYSRTLIPCDSHSCHPGCSLQCRVLTGVVNDFGAQHRSSRRFDSHETKPLEDSFGVFGVFCVLLDVLSLCNIYCQPLPHPQPILLVTISSLSSFLSFLVSRSIPPRRWAHTACAAHESPHEVCQP